MEEALAKTEATCGRRPTSWSPTPTRSYGLVGNIERGEGPSIADLNISNLVSPSLEPLNINALMMSTIVRPIVGNEGCAVSKKI